MYAVRYPAPGAPELAREVADLLRPVEVVQDLARGFDHGSWSILIHMYPSADVPVVQLALDGTQPAAVHLAFGAKLAGLRDSGVLILGSGNVVHNLRRSRFRDDVEPFDWNLSFDAHIREALERGDSAALCDYAARPDGRLAVPTPERYLPVVYVAGARTAGEPVTTIVDGFLAGAFRCTRFASVDSGSRRLDRLLGAA